MIILDDVTKSLEVVLDSAITTSQPVIVGSYVDVTTTTYTPGANDTVSNNTTPVTIVAAPGVWTQRQVKLITVYNKDTVAAIATIQYNDNTTIRIIVKITLDTGSTLVYTDGEGWRVINSSGAILSSGATGAIGPAGPRGVQGFFSLDGLDGEESHIPGPQGLVGPIGNTGSTGSTGPTGVPGPPGIDGEEPDIPYIIPGPIGPTGAAGSGNAGLKQSFNGLQLRTSPNNDVALTTVAILNLTQWTANDGTLVTESTPLSNNTALITASGAGGLDTGSEAASTWYEIYRLRKSSDGTLNTMFHRALDWTSDTLFTTATNINLALRLSTLTSTDKLAQGVTFASSKPFVFTNVQLIASGTPPTGSIWFTLESDSAGSPSGVVLATSDKINAALISTANQIIRIIFRTPYTVTASIQYHLVLQGDYTRSDTVNISWGGVVAGGYTGGVAKSYNGASWTNAAGLGDFYFNAFCEFNNAALTLPSGYDQYVKLGYVYNNSGSDFILFNQVGNLSRFLIKQSLGSITATLMTLSSMSTILPPTPVTLETYLQNNTAANGVTISGVPDGFRDTGQDCGPGGGIESLLNGSNYSNLTLTNTDFQGIYVRARNNTATFQFTAFEWLK